MMSLLGWVLLSVGGFGIEVAPPPREVEAAPPEDPARRIERIIRQAQEVGDRLSRKDAGPQTQAQQEGILREIDALLEAREPRSSDPPMPEGSSSGSETPPPPPSGASPPSGQPSPTKPMAPNDGHSDSVNPEVPPRKTGERSPSASDSSPQSGESPAKPGGSPTPTDDPSSSTKNPSSQSGGEKPTPGPSRSTTGGPSSNGSQKPSDSATSRPGGLPSVSNPGPRGGVRGGGGLSQGMPRRVYRNRMDREGASGVEAEAHLPVPTPGNPMVSANKPPIGKDIPGTPASVGGTTPVMGGPVPVARPLFPWGGDFEKDVWGHLPQQLRQQVSQYYRQQFMPKYADLLRHYYSSLSRGESSSAPPSTP